MTQMQGVNVPMPTTPMQQIETETGLNTIELAFVQLLIKNVLPPDKAESVNKILQNVAGSMNTLASIAQVTEEALQEAIRQRDAAYEGAQIAMDQRNKAIRELDTLTRAVQQIDQSDPDVAALVLRVWTDAQADILQQIDSQRGA